jgi:cell wall-associated NlpC family hydrolase
MIGDRVLAEARALLGTPWRHLGRSETGIDCIGLVLVAAARVGIVLPDPAPYTREPSGQTLRQGMASVLDHVPLAEVEPGDVLVMNLGLYAGHVGLYAVHPTYGAPAVVHAYLPRKRVVEELLEQHRAAVTGAFRFREG